MSSTYSHIIDCPANITSLSKQSDRVSCRLVNEVNDGIRAMDAAILEQMMTITSGKRDIVRVFDSLDSWKSIKCSEHMEFRAGNNVVPLEARGEETMLPGHWTHNYKLKCEQKN